MKWWKVVWRFCKTYPKTTAALLCAAKLEAFIVWGVPAVYEWWINTPTRATSVHGQWLWWVFAGLAVVGMLALLIQGRGKITSGWKVWGAVLGSIAILALATCGALALTLYWYEFIGWRYWLHTLCGIGALGLLAIVIWLYNRRSTGSAAGTTVKKGDGLKKGLELFLALGKVAALFALTGIMVFFLVGPKYFWGEPIVIERVGVERQATGQRYANTIDILVPTGSVSTPIEQWSAPLQLNGRRSEFFARTEDGRKGLMAIHADGNITVVPPGHEPHIGSPRELRFLSLTNFPLRILGSME